MIKNQYICKNIPHILLNAVVFNIVSLMENSQKKYILTKDLSSRDYHILRERAAMNEFVKLKAGLYVVPDVLSDFMIDIDKIIPGGVLCMYSAWFLYELTTVIPSAFCVAIDRNRKVIVPAYPSINIYYWKKDLLGFGIIEQEIMGFKILVTDLERSVCDAVKYRNKIGIDICAEVLKTYLQRPDRDLSKLHEYAKLLRVNNVLKSYLEIQL